MEAEKSMTLNPQLGVRLMIDVSLEVLDVSSWNTTSVPYRMWDVVLHEKY